ncbi:hypothetical protein [Accumulibacter sp.]|uniref:hypothetical protein n=1 Tax=Accumulibacter sp. TaxID=2053492 RepID=UPI002588959E|nr:hypothetical protein [Accumulibacter sp.]
MSLGGLFGLLCAVIGGQGQVRHGALIAAAYGLGQFLTGVSWVYVSLSVFGGMPAALAGLATLLFCGVLAIYPALAGALFVRLAAPGYWPRALLFAALWVLTEGLRAWVFTGFPWLSAGYSQTPPSPLAGYVPLLGVHGASLASALLGALIFEIVRRWLSPPTALHAAGCAGVRLCRWSPLPRSWQPANCCARSAGRRRKVSHCRWPCCRATWRRK